MPWPKDIKHSFTNCYLSVAVKPIDLLRPSWSKSPSTTSSRRSPAHGAQYSLVVMKVGGLALMGQEVAHQINKRTRGSNEEAFYASVRRHLGQGRRRGGGARGG